MKILYSEETVRREKTHVRRGAILAAAVGGIALTVCIALCFGVRTANAESRRLTVILISTLAGWTVISLIRGLVLPEWRECRHEEGLLLGIWDPSANRFFREESERHRGEILSVGPVFRIPKSISFHAVTLREESGDTQLRLNARAYRDFPPVGSVITAASARKYITEYEVRNDA